MDALYIRDNIEMDVSGYVSEGGGYWRGCLNENWIEWGYICV